MKAIVELCLAAFRFALQEVLPANVVKRNVTFTPANGAGLLTVNNRSYNVNKNVHIVAVGKAAVGMIVGAEQALGPNLVDGIASVPFGSEIPPGLKTKIYDGAKNNLPDEDAVENARKIVDFLKRVRAPDQLVLFLISGGGSSLLPSPIPGLSLQEKLHVIKTLASNGADIKQLNTVRRALSTLKGGGLSKLGAPSRMLSLIISDVIGDPLEFISSGPTVLPPADGDNRTPFDVFRELNVTEKIPQKVLDLLSSKQSGKEALSSDQIDVNNVIICNNKFALESTARYFKDNGTVPYLMTSELEGDATELGYGFAQFILDCLRKGSVDWQSLGKISPLLVGKGDLSNGIAQKRLALLFGGESTVRFDASKAAPNAKGGRNQELVLAALQRLLNETTPPNFGRHAHFALFSLGTDGQDGPTDATGAFITDGDLLSAKKGLTESVRECLESKNSYGFWTEFNGGTNLVKQNKTGTNLMDIQIVYLEFE